MPATRNIGRGWVSNFQEPQPMRIILAIVFVASCSVHVAAQPRVDASIREQRSCRLSAGGFPDDLHGWIGDLCGGLFKTDDGGATWRVLGHDERGIFTGRFGGISKLIWPTPSLGLALINGGRTAYRTTDGGATWTPITVPTEQWPYAVERAGHRIWSCGSAGTIIRSDDDGASWRPLLGSPFNDKDRCMALSFLDGKDGWASGMEGSLYATGDGGESWRSIPSPAKEHAEVLRYDTSLAWVSAREGLFVTVNGGASWTPVKPDKASLDHLYVTRVGDRTFFTRNQASKPSELIPVISENVAPWGTHGAVALGRGTWLVDFFRDGNRVRSSPIVARTGAATVEPLSGVSTIDADRRFGWSAGHVYHSEDAGRSWFLVGDTPGSPKRLQFLDERNAVAETDRGWFRSFSGGRSWQPSRNADWDRFDADSAAGSKAASPLACTLSAPSGSLELTFGFQGCFGGTQSSLKLVWHQGGTGSLGEEPIPRERVREILRSIIAAAEKREVPSQCSSTNHSFATLKWSCAGKAREVSFSSSECAPHQRVIGAATYSGATTSGDYARAIGLGELGEQLGGATTNRASPRTQ